MTCLWCCHILAHLTKRTKSIIDFQILLYPLYFVHFFFRLPKSDKWRIQASRQKTDALSIRWRDVTGALVNYLGFCYTCEKHGWIFHFCVNVYMSNQRQHSLVCGWISLVCGWVGCEPVSLKHIKFWSAIYWYIFTYTNQTYNIKALEKIWTLVWTFCTPSKWYYL